MVRAGVRFLLLFGLYLLLVAQVSPDELIAGASCAAAATALSQLIPFIAARHLRLNGVPWPHVIGATLRALGADTLRVGAWLARPTIPPGTLHRQPFAAAGHRPEDTARRGLVTLAASVAPNTCVVAVLTGKQELLVHRLAPAEPPQARDWPL